MSTRQSQCTKCHRFLTGASSPEVGHLGAPGGSVCSLSHHPEPCSYTDEDGAICTFYESIRLDEDSAASSAASAMVSVATTAVSAGDSPDVVLLQQQLHQLQQEKEAERRRANLLQLSNSNLQQVQARLQAEVSLWGSSPSMTTGTSFPPATTTTTVTPSAFVPRMGTGFSQTFSSPSPSLQSGVSTVPTVLNSAAASLAASNVSPPPPPSSIHGYNGPTLPDMRSNPQMNELANQVFSLILREVPALASASSVPVAYPSSSYSTPVVPPPVSVPPGGLPGALPAAAPRPVAAAMGPPPLFGPHPQSLGVPAAQLSPEQIHIQQLQQQIQDLQAQHRRNQPRQEVPEDSSQVSCVSLDSLYSATVKNAQYRASDFCKLGNFSYLSQIKQNNLNLVLFTYGSLRHILALNDGTLPYVQREEFNSRLQHLINVMEITCLGSNLSDYDGYGWRVGREYDNRVIRDIEQGLKDWGSLAKSIDPTAWTFAREMVPKSKPNNQPPKGNSGGNNGQKACTTYNTFRNPGCHYEHTNPGEKCIYLHFCSHCRSKGFNRRHKVWQCNEPDAPKPPLSGTTPTSVPATSA